MNSEVLSEYPPLTSDFIKGVDFILGHFKDIYYPRNIMTVRTFLHGHGQITVRSREEILEAFRQSRAIDCRINAFPELKPNYYKPDLIFIDLDLSNFKSRKSLDNTLNRIIKKIKDKLGGTPTVLWTGNGYHIYQPIESIESCEFEKIGEFNGFDNVAEEFLVFASIYLSGNKKDQNHNPKFRSSLLRIPFSRNSKCIKEKADPEVKVLQKWNGYRPHMKLLIGNFHAYLIDKRNEENRKLKSRTPINKQSGVSYWWIETLLETPISQYRKNTVALILAPYLINVRKLTFEESDKIIMGWLNGCNALNKLNFNPTHKVRTDLHYALISDYKPLRFDNLRLRNPGLYQIIKARI